MGLPSRALVWLVASFALLLAPQWDRLPVWLMAACGVLAAWRFLAQVGRVRLPGRWLRTGIMLILVAVYIATVQGRFTVDTAASFFVLAVGLKWLETRTPRDFYVLFFILVYLATVNFLFHQDIHWARYSRGMAMACSATTAPTATIARPSHRGGSSRFLGLGCTCIRKDDIDGSLLATGFCCMTLASVRVVGSLSTNDCTRRN